MSYSTPKTDWVSTDHFNITDYDRIRNNLAAVYDIAVELYNDVAGYNTCPTVSAGGWWASWVFNRIENNLYNINRYVYSLEIGTKKTFYNNQQFIDSAELNRVETGTQMLYEMLTAQQRYIQKMPVTCGGRMGDEF